MKSNAEMNEKSLEITAEIFEPMCDLMMDKEFAKLYVTDLKKAMAYACKAHKEEVIKIASALEGTTPDKYVVNPFLLPINLIATIGAYAKMAKDLFPSQARSTEETSSGSATENTEVIDQQTDS